MSTEMSSRYAEVDGLRLHYLEAGRGAPVLLLHGWPTSSFLWRNVMGEIAEHNRVIALDLPGFGKSDKPLDVSYGFRFYSRILDGFLDGLGIGATSMAVHDLGGPVGLYWACHNPQRLRSLALLNTLVYPQLSWAVMAFIAACRMPGLGMLLASPKGLRLAMRIGVANRECITEEVVAGVQAPFRTRDARRALLKTAYGLEPKLSVDIERLLPSISIPVRIVYGERDRILPDVAKTMQRVMQDFPQAELTALPNCGHFLQEDDPDEVGRLLADFFSRTTRSTKDTVISPM